MNLLLQLLLLGMPLLTSAKRPNVLFIAVDDLRPQIGFYHASPAMHTPSIDSLAKRSLVLLQAYSQQAVCSPSRTSLLTSRRPDTTRVFDLVTYFRHSGGNFTTLPQYFKENGYETVGAGKIFHPGQASGGNDPISWTQPYFTGDMSYWKGVEYSWKAVNDSEILKDPLIDQQIARYSIQKLEKLANSTKPFFLAVGFHKPHLPFIFPQNFMKYYPLDKISLPNNAYAPIDMPEMSWSNYDELRKYDDIAKLGNHGSINSTLPDKVTLSLRRAYYASVSYMDSLVGRLLKKLNQLGLDNSTIVVLWGDHGWQLGEHALWCKHTNFELATRVPLMLRVPGQTDHGNLSPALTELVDLFPTLVDAANLPPVPLCPQKGAHKLTLCTEGVSFLPLINNPFKTWKSAAFSQYPRMAIDGNIYMGYSIRTLQYRFTEWVEYHGYPDWEPRFGHVHHKNDRELYDHSTDPDENVNRAFDPKYTSIVEDLSKKIKAGWRKALPPSELSSLEHQKL